MSDVTAAGEGTSPAPESQPEGNSGSAAPGGEKPAGKSKAAKERKAKRRPGLFRRIALFVRQIIAEMRKVVTPTRSEWINQSVTVLVFVLVIMVFITGVDFLVGLGTKWAFGG